MSWAAIEGSEKLYLNALKPMEQSHSIAVMGAAIAKHLFDLNNSDILNDYMVCSQNINNI